MSKKWKAIKPLNIIKIESDMIIGMTNQAKLNRSNPKALIANQIAFNETLETIVRASMADKQHKSPMR